MSSILKEKSKIQPILPMQPNNSKIQASLSLPKIHATPSPPSSTNNTGMDSSTQAKFDLLIPLFMLSFPRRQQQQHRVSASSVKGIASGRHLPCRSACSLLMKPPLRLGHPPRACFRCPQPAEGRLPRQPNIFTHARVLLLLARLKIPSAIAWVISRVARGNPDPKDEINTQP